MANARRRTQRNSRTTARMAARNGGAAEAALEADEVPGARIAEGGTEMKYIKKDLRELLIISIFLFALLFLVGFLM